MLVAPSMIYGAGTRACRAVFDVRVSQPRRRITLTTWLHPGLRPPQQEVTAPWIMDHDVVFIVCIEVVSLCRAVPEAGLLLEQSRRASVVRPP